MWPFHIEIDMRDLALLPRLTAGCEFRVRCSCWMVEQRRGSCYAYSMSHMSALVMRCGAFCHDASDRIYIFSAYAIWHWEIVLITARNAALKWLRGIMYCQGMLHYQNYFVTQRDGTHCPAWKTHSCVAGLTYEVPLPGIYELVKGNKGRFGLNLSCLHFF